MNVFMAMPWIPVPPVDGGRFRSYYLLREVARRHAVTLFCVRNPGETLEGLEEVRPWCRDVACADSGLRYTIAAKLASLLRFSPFGSMPPGGAVDAAIARLAGQGAFDVIHLQGIELANCARRLSQPGRVLFDMVDCNSLQMRRRTEQLGEPARRLWYAIQTLKYRQAERQLLAQPLTMTLAGQADIDALLRLPRHPSLRAELLVNGIDVPPPGEARNGRDSSRLVFSGNMAYPPNDDAARHFIDAILPVIRWQRPEVGFDIVGKEPSEALQRHCQGIGNVQVLGRVPDVRTEIARYGVYVCPLRVGTGIKVKLLEAMACGMAIVATPVSVEGMPVEDGRHLLLARSAQEFAAQVLRLLGDEPLRRLLGAHARELARTHYAWPAVGDRLDQLYREVAA